jgi:hypothetical protein
MDTAKTFRPTNLSERYGMCFCFICSCWIDYALLHDRRCFAISNFVGLGPLPGALQIVAWKRCGLWATGWDESSTLSPPEKQASNMRPLHLINWCTRRGKTKVGMRRTWINSCVCSLWNVWLCRILVGNIVSTATWLYPNVLALQLVHAHLQFQATIFYGGWLTLQRLSASASEYEIIFM